MIKQVFNAVRGIYPKLSLREFYNSIVFIAKSVLHYSILKQFVAQIHATGYTKVLSLQPNVLGFLVWPYIHNHWSVGERFERIAKHYDYLRNFPKFLDVADGQARNIINLGHYSDGTVIVLDKPQWFVREGEITLNVFKADLRVMSLAFSFGQSEKGLTVYIGCIQGIHSGISSEDSLEIIRNLTKDFEGLRPRGLVIEILRMVAAAVDAKAIFAISEMNRQHRHKFHKNYLAGITTTNYDEIWQEVGGVLRSDGFYEIPLPEHRKDYAEIPAKKRAQYRRRYQILDGIKTELSKLSVSVVGSTSATFVSEYSNLFLTYV